MNYDNVAEMFKITAQEMSDKCDYLCALDAQMGDGDLGLTMKKGFQEVANYLVLENDNNGDIGKSLFGAGMKMLQAVPSTMGTLMASAILTGSAKLQGLKEIDANNFASFIEGMADGIQKRGKCVLGDCTVLDALVPAAEYARIAADQELSLSEVVSAAYQGSLVGVARTMEMETSKGKAAVFRNNSIGKPDQGAVAASIMLKGFESYFRY